MKPMVSFYLVLSAQQQKKNEKEKESCVICEHGDWTVLRGAVTAERRRQEKSVTLKLKELQIFAFSCLLYKGKQPLLFHTWPFFE